MKAKLPPEIDVLREISSVLVCERNVRDILEKVLDILEERMGMLRGTFTLLDGDEVSIEASRGLGEREKAHGHYRLGEGITGTVAKTGRVEVVPDIHMACATPWSVRKCCPRAFLGRTADFGGRPVPCDRPFITFR